MPVAFHLTIVLAAWILTIAQPGFAQQTGQQPTDVKGAEPAPPVSPTPKATTSAQQETAQLSEFASQLLQYTEAVGCHKHHCKLLVVDLLSPEGKISPYGIKLADDLTAELARQQKGIRLVDRSLLQRQLEKLREERVPANVQHSVPVARWLGQELGASIVLIGEIVNVGSQAISVSARMQDVKDEKLASPSSEVRLPLPPSMAELIPSNILPPLAQLGESINGERVYRAGVQGAGTPKCSYVPNPPYTDEARKFDLSGSLILLAVVEPNGSVKPFRIERGLPFGLNASSLKTLQNWKCTPAMFDGEPVAVLVPMEVTFRVYRK
ncbi:MAG TPA: energy transducer TonB [Candidatus Acidoferrum sp.]|nr:energy transducer TonB [Candidatus Acidoferrum sp.]